MDREKEALAAAERAKQNSLAARLSQAFDERTEPLFGGLRVKIRNPTAKQALKYQAWIQEATEPFKDALVNPDEFLAKLPEEDREDMARKVQWFHTEATLKVLLLVAPELGELDADGNRVMSDDQILFFVEEEGGDMCPLLRRARSLVRAGAKLSDPFGSRKNTRGRRKKS